MAHWLSRLFSPRTSRGAATTARSSESLVESLTVWLGGGALEPAAAAGWCAAVEELHALDGLEAHLPAMRAALASFYARHPIEIHFGRDYKASVVDPLPLDLDMLAGSGATVAFAPWTRTVRTLQLRPGRRLPPQPFVDDVNAVLAHPDLPETIAFLAIPSCDLHSVAEIDRLVTLLCTAPQLRSLEHLVFQSVLIGLTPAHVVQLAAAPWAATLRSLAFSEQMVNWSVDLDAAERLPAYRALGELRGLTHLHLYNNIGDGADVEALLASGFPALTHLNVGALYDPAALDALLDRTKLPALRELCIDGDIPRTHPVWDRVVASGVPVYLHSRLVSASYPARGG